jgi:chromosome partitioning protein
MIPIQCEYYALEGLSQLLQNVDLVKGTSIRIWRWAVWCSPCTTPAPSWPRTWPIRCGSTSGRPTYRALIPRSVRLSEAPSYGEPIEAFDGMSRGAIAYRNWPGSSGAATDWSEEER